MTSNRWLARANVLKRIVAANALPFEAVVERVPHEFAGIDRYIRPLIEWQRRVARRVVVAPVRGSLALSGATVRPL